jgi:ubiquinone/menaquinone biosynthesis C-methylase UbiE
MMMKEIPTIIEAIKWYAKLGMNQYSEENVELYDRAAATLTQRQKFGSFLMQHLGDNGKLLEIGAGTGLISEAIDEHVEDAIYTDSEEPALKLLRRRLGKAAVVKADFFKLPFEDKSFDTVIGVGTHRYVPKERASEFWSEMDRVTADNGRVVIAQFYPRFFPLSGNDISNKDNGQPFFSVVDKKEFDAKIEIAGLPIKSGTYRSFEFRRPK